VGIPPVIWMFPKIGGKPPKWMVKSENNGKPYFSMDDEGGKPKTHYFSETSKKRGFNGNIHFNRVFHYKPSILGYLYLGNTHIYTLTNPGFFSWLTMEIINWTTRWRSWSV